MFGWSAKISAIAGAITAGIFVAVVAYGLHAWSVDNLNEEHEKALQAQKIALVADCQKDKSITKEADDEIYRNHADIDGVLGERLRDTSSPACLPVTGDTRGASTPASGGNVHTPDGRNNGVSRADLYRLAADADKIRADLLTCRTFLTNTWAAKGQKLTAH